MLSRTVTQLVHRLSINHNNGNSTITPTLQQTLVNRKECRVSGWPSGSSTVQVCFSALFSSKVVGLWTLPSNLALHDKLKGSFQCRIVHSGSKCSARSSSQHSRQISFKTKTKQNLLTKKAWRKTSSVRKSAAVRHVYSPNLSLTSDL